MDILDVFKDLPVNQTGIVKTSEIVFDPEVREMCKADRCGNYGKNWACPPAGGSYEECREKVLAYDKGVVFNKVSNLKNSYDWQGMVRAIEEFRTLCLAVRDRANEALEDAWVLSGGGCNHCKKCTYPDEPCRFPDMLIEPTEGQGIVVNRLAEAAGVNYISGKDTVTYVGMLLYHEK